jgi:hypothetical protein
MDGKRIEGEVKQPESVTTSMANVPRVLLEILIYGTIEDKDKLNQFMVPCNISSNKLQNNFIDVNVDVNNLFTLSDKQQIQKLLDDYELDITVENFIEILKNFFINFNIQQFKVILADKYDSSLFFVIKNILELVLGNDLTKDEKYKDLLLIIQTVIDSDSLSNQNTQLTNCVHYDPYSELADRLSKLNFSQDEIQQIVDSKRETTNDKIKVLCKVIKNKNNFEDLNISLGKKYDDVNDSIIDNVFNTLSINN